MEPDSKKILYATDLSPNSGYALRYALDCDMIIMGTHGKGIIENTFLGSTAKRVLRRTRKPIFIIPLPKDETDVTIREQFMA